MILPTISVPTPPIIFTHFHPKKQRFHRDPWKEVKKKRRIKQARLARSAVVRFRGGIRGGDLAGSQIAITRLSKIEVSGEGGWTATSINSLARTGSVVAPYTATSHVDPRFRGCEARDCRPIAPR